MNGLPAAIRSGLEEGVNTPSRGIKPKWFLYLLLTLWILPVTAFADNQLKSIDFSALPGDQLQLRLSLSEKIVLPASFTTESPARIALDFAEVSSALDYKTLPIGVGAVQSVTALEAGNRTRVVINLISTVAFTL
jgi:type IV pilus assembly protein PilQ